ncbi:P-loop NTPase [Halomicroarcula limicola]|uniref:Iron-sulfur cluster carrier protein n=1 Tax=Haloarcula limicola TaxID=1429915 RepID=A0A8J7Y9M6_9EURY|nr:P-loop NTPase [Halomicroarcula limicola]MBV0923794.1 P-loop NTPase [Halomicroarcula limicola]
MSQDPSTNERGDGPAAEESTDDRPTNDETVDRPDADEPNAGTDLSDAVEAALRQVRDPEADVTVFEAGLIEDVRVADGDVTVEADLGDFPPREAEAVTATMVRALSDVEGVQRAHVEHVDPTPDVEGREAGITTADRVVAVASAKGGVGKTTVAANLACALAADGDDVGLFDADIHGPNVPELLSVSGPVHSDEDGNPIPVDADGLDVMSVGLMSSSAPLAWRGAMAHDALSELFEETAWDDPDTVVLDLPPGTGDIALTTLQEVPVDGVVFVTTPFHAAVSDTHRSIQLFRENDVPVLGVVSNMGEFVCEGCGEVHDLFDGEDPIDALDAPLLADIPFDGEMQGTPRPAADGVPSHARELGDAVRERLADIWDVDVPDRAVDLRGVAPADRHERVRAGFEALDSGTEFHVVSDRNPAAVREYLLDVAGEGVESLERFEVRQQNPETWIVRTVRP